jgi:cytochrome c oxidase cbb3-type subunit 3
VRGRLLGNPALGRDGRADYVQRPMRASFGAALALFLVVPLSAGCDRPPSASELKEWTPRDHDRMEENARAAAGMQPGSQQNIDPQQELIEVTWRSKCTQCHGPAGHGDGPSGPMVKAPDLTSPDWQDKTSDGEIATVIKSGRNKMPAFQDLPDETVAGLVQRIRASRGAQ